jgi:thioesterase domain-containing protein
MTPELRDRFRQCRNDIVKFLHSAEALARQQRAIVPLQPRGTRAPVFAVAGHNGDVFCYRVLVKYLGDEQPFYGLYPPGLDGQSEPLPSVEHLAAYFAGQILAFHPEGHCIIAGYCAGGTIAFELARQLLQRGTTVSLVALFGSPYPSWFRPLPQLRHDIERLFQHASALASRPWDERLQYIASKMQTKRDAAREKVEKTTMAAVRHYTPAFFAGRVAIFLPNKKWVSCGAAPLRWRSVAQHFEEYFGSDTCEVDSMLREPFAPDFAELFRQCREKQVLNRASASDGCSIDCN